MFKIVIVSLCLFLNFVPTSYAGFGGDDSFECGNSDFEVSQDQWSEGGGCDPAPVFEGNYGCFPERNFFDLGGIEIQGHEGGVERSAISFSPDTDFTDWIGWVPWPRFDYSRRRAILQLSHPEDRMYHSKRYQIFTGSPNNPHQVTDDRFFLLGLSVGNSNVAGFGGFGPGIGYYYKADKEVTRITDSYEEAYQSVAFDLPKTFDDVLQWPVGTKMTYGGMHYGRLYFLAGAFFNGIDASLLARKGFTVKITKEERKINVSFITQAILGAKAGVFITPFIRGNVQGLGSRIYSYTFQFGHEKPSPVLIKAFNALIKQKKPDQAMALSAVAGSGVRIVTEKQERRSERSARLSVGLPVIGRYNKAKLVTRSITDKVIDGKNHEIHQISHVKLKNTRLLRRRRPDSGEPRVIQNQNHREKEAIAAIDWQEGIHPKLIGRITYLREFDKIALENLQENIQELGTKLFLTHLNVNFPSQLPPGASTLKLDILLEQGSLYRLINLSKKNPKLFKDQTEAYLREFLSENKTALNPFYDPVTQSISKKSKKALLQAQQDIDEIIAELKLCRPIKRIGPESQKARIQDVKRLGTLVQKIATNPLLLVALRSFGNDLIKYHYELKGEHFNPYVLNF